MSVSSNTVSVANTATRIGPTTGGGYSGPRASLSVRNGSAQQVFLGGSGVTASTGFPLNPDETQSVDLFPGDELYGIVSSGTATVYYLQASV